MRSNSLGGMRPARTRLSVPRLMPPCKARIRTSPCPGSVSGSARISALPAPIYHNAWVVRSGTFVIPPWTLYAPPGYILNGTRKQGDCQSYARSCDCAFGRGRKPCYDSTDPPPRILCFRGKHNHSRRAVARTRGSTAIQRRSHRLSCTLYDYPAVGGDRILECRYWISDHAFLPRPSRGREPAGNEHS